MKISLVKLISFNSCLLYWNTRIIKYFLLVLFLFTHSSFLLPILYCCLLLYTKYVHIGPFLVQKIFQLMNIMKLYYTLLLTVIKLHFVSPSSLTYPLTHNILLASLFYHMLSIGTFHFSRYSSSLLFIDKILKYFLTVSWLILLSLEHPFTYCKNYSIDI